MRIERQLAESATRDCVVDVVDAEGCRLGAWRANIRLRRELPRRKSSHSTANCERCVGGSQAPGRDLTPGPFCVYTVSCRLIKLSWVTSNEKGPRLLQHHSISNVDLTTFPDSWRYRITGPTNTRSCVGGKRLVTHAPAVKSYNIKLVSLILYN